MAKSCFFCGADIDSKQTREHIFADAFLRDFDLKNKVMHFRGRQSVQYSRIRVPAHARCNNEFGSRFESYVLELLRSLDDNLDTLRQMHLLQPSETAKRVREALCQWLAKLHFGLIYWEAHLVCHRDRAYQRNLAGLLQSEAFTYMRRCFIEFYAFNCPSSLYHFDLPDPPHPALRFDFGSALDTSAFYVRIDRHLLVVALADAYLVQEWLTPEVHGDLQRQIEEQGSEDPVCYLHAVGQIWSVRENLPVRPHLLYSDDAIRDHSRLGHDAKPSINGERVNDRAEEITAHLAERFRPALDRRAEWQWPD